MADSFSKNMSITFQFLQQFKSLVYSASSLKILKAFPGGEQCQQDIWKPTILVRTLHGTDMGIYVLKKVIGTNV